MKIYDEGIFLSHLELEIAKSKRYGYLFSLLAIKAKDPHRESMTLLTSILEANYRDSDVVSLIDRRIFVVLLNATNEENAHRYLARLINKAVTEKQVPVVAAVISNNQNGTQKDYLQCVLQKID